MPNFREQVRAVLCTAGSAAKMGWGQVKVSCLDSTMPGWKDGQLHVAEDNRGNYVLVVEYKNAPHKMFQLKNNVKSKTLLPSNPTRTVIAMRDGSMVHLMKAHANALEVLSNTIDTISKPGKMSIAGATPQYGLRTSPPSAALLSPYKRVAVSHSPREQATTPRRTSSGDGRNFTTVKSRTPTSQRKFSPFKSNKRKTPDDEEIEIGSDDDENLGASMLFTDQMDKENQYTPSRNERQSVLQMRRGEGGSLFQESHQEQRSRTDDRRRRPEGTNFLSLFEDKQEEIRRRGPKPAVGASSNFYGKNRPSGYGTTDLLSRPTSTPKTQTLTESNSVKKKRTPGFLSVTSSSKWKSSFQPWKNTGNAGVSRNNLHGFSNLGNTCYMNAILQSLLGLRCFANDLQNLEVMRAVPKPSLYKALTRLLYAKQNQRGSTEVGVHLQRVKAAISATATRFSGFMQHDAHEFLCQCLDQLKEDVEKVSRAPPEDQEPVSPSNQVVPSKEKGEGHKFSCAVTQNFTLEVVHSILCQGCGEEVTKREAFNDLSLDLPRTNEAFSLQTALDSFFASEKLEYACAKCDCREAIVTHKFTKAPRVLVLHLKRYTYSSEALSNGKLKVSVGIPRFLTLSWHTSKTTSPPPPQKGFQPTQALPLSPLRDCMRTPSSPLNSPLPTGGSGGIRKKLDYEDKERSVFRFKRIRQPTDSPKKENSHFISRYDDDLRMNTHNKSTRDAKDKELHEMNEDQQLALALELSRKDAEASMSAKKAPIFRDEPTDEELVLALDRSETEKEMKEQRKISGKSLIIEDSDSDDELPPGLSDLPPGLSVDAEDAQLKEALEQSRKSLQEEMERKERCWMDRSSISRPVVDVGLLGGARDSAFKDVHKAQRTNQLERYMHRVDRTDNTKSTVSNSNKAGEGESDKDMSKMPSRTSRGLFGGAENDDLGKSDPGDSTGSDEPMDVDSTEQPLAFSMDGGQNDPAQPSMGDLETQLTNQIRESNSSQGSATKTCQSSRDGDNLEVLSGVSDKDDEEGVLTLDGSKDVVKNESGHPEGQNSAERRKSREEDGKETLSYDEMKAKEEEDIRRATELSMKEAREIQEKEAAEILRAQEMSLQDFELSSGLTPPSDQELGEPTKISPIYSQEEIDTLTKHSEDGHLGNAYRLVSIVSHIGSTSMTGHYVSDVYNPEKRIWLSYDDSTVMKRDERTIREERQRTGYIFFYEAKEFL